ncbi:MAG: hypothetical protein MUE85_12795 [Microscillaceae bacterium]|jgi:hypothetical protein|nr:hypothetical protein [Microscillaceae bacterium]
MSYINKNKFVATCIADFQMFVLLDTIGSRDECKHRLQGMLDFLLNN